ncbi:hypothetical protein MTO96_007828 [Rhipicephalus appendiculatus]
MWENPLSILGSCIQQNLIDSVLLRQQTGQPTARFDTGILAVQLTEEEAQIGHRVNYNPLHEIERLIVFNWFYWGLLLPVSIGLITSSFVILPSMEICNEARELQLMTGVSGCVYFGAHFIFDLLFYLVPMTAIYLGFGLIYNLSSNTQGAMILVILLSAPVNILLPYVISEHSADSGTAYAVNLGLFAIAGPGIVLAYLFTSLATDGQDIRLPFFFFPSFQLPATSVRAANIESEVAACNYLRGRQHLRDNHLNFCNYTKLFGSTIKFCCDVLQNKTKEPWYDVQALSFSPHGIFYDVLFMLIYGGAMFLYLLHRVSRHRSLRSAFPEGKAVVPKDEDVAAQWSFVEKICKQGDFSENVMVARRLHKCYGPQLVVKELSFALKPAECFGLLGVNGAGKTTTFRMLTALTPMTYGEAFMKDIVLCDEPLKWQSRIGYCTQGNALLGKLSAYENLYLFGRLRGVPEASLPDAVEHIIGVTELREHAAKHCDIYSGGNKRKLSIAIALIGLPEVVFLDEPYAGVDVLARTRIYTRLNDIKDRTKCSMVLTSHSMEECEVSCDRICIMVEGTMVCLGTLQHLKDKFGKGCVIKFLLLDDSKLPSEELKQDVGKLFPGMTVLKATEGLLEIRTHEKLRWSVLFQRIELLEKTISFESVLASDNTLEQLFIEFAEKDLRGHFYLSYSKALNKKLLLLQGARWLRKSDLPCGL